MGSQINTTNAMHAHLHKFTMIAFDKAKKTYRRALRADIAQPREIN